jgi:hypothetical protein
MWGCGWPWVSLVWNQYLISTKKTATIFRLTFTLRGVGFFAGKRLGRASFARVGEGTGCGIPSATNSRPASS